MCPACQALKGTFTFTFTFTAQPQHQVPTSCECQAESLLGDHPGSAGTKWAEQKQYIHHCVHMYTPLKAVCKWLQSPLLTGGMDMIQDEQHVLYMDITMTASTYSLLLDKLSIQCRPPFSRLCSDACLLTSCIGDMEAQAICSLLCALPETRVVST